MGYKYLSLNGCNKPAYKRHPTKVPLLYASVAVQKITIAGIVGAIAVLHIP